jgi:aryl-alcohol dehydrogenase-like predicted oxidoreductase
MKLRQLGDSGMQIAPLMFGGNVFGWTADKATSFEILDAFVGRGFNFIDTADMYSRWKPGNEGGESETIIGEWFARSGKRSQVVLATKVGMDMGGEKKGLAAKYILEEVEASLRRLKTDYIDLYQSHVDDQTVPLDETLGAYRQLIAQGKVRMIGASNYSGARLREAVELAQREDLPMYQTLQPRYNLYDRQRFEQDMQPVAKELRIGVIPYFALASGFLTGKYRSLQEVTGRSREPRLKDYFDERGMRILQTLDEVAEETGAQQATVALAWLMAQETILAPIASATSVEQLGALLAAPELTLSEAAMKKLNEASAY